MPDRVDDLIRQAAQTHGVPAELALSVAEQESAFNPLAKNPSGATGTFQIMPATAQMLGIDARDPRQNIDGGVKYLRQLMDQHNGDLTQVLNNYGGDKTHGTYAPQVLARMGKFKVQAPVAAADPPRVGIFKSDNDPSAPPPKPSLLTAGVHFGREVLKGFDVTTEPGRRNVAGGVGAAAATALAPELAVPGWIARGLSVAKPIVGAYLGGAGENAGEQGVRAATGSAPSDSSISGAGREQAGYETLGQAFTRGIAQPVARRLAASTISTRISTALDDAIRAAKDRIGMQRPSATPSQAGKLAHEVAYGQDGAAKSVKDQFGQDVDTAAKGGPDLPTQPLKDRLQELATQITPMASHTQAATIPGYSPAQVAAIAQKNPGLGLSAIPSDHPLPAALDRIRETLADHDTISFEDAHKVKRLLDDVTNWDSPAKNQVKQITKGFRQTLRSQMEAHGPYNQATARYGEVAKLYDALAIKSLRNAAQTNPSVVVQKLSWKNPDSVQMVKELLHDVPQQGAKADEGAASWAAVRAAWTHENLFAKGPEQMVKTIGQIESSGQGPAFIQSMYGGPEGQRLWQNTKQLATAWQAANQHAQDFAGSNLAHTSEMAGTVRDLALATAMGHPIGKVGATARFLLGKGNGAQEMLTWAAHSDATTKFVVNNVLTGPKPGIALADMLRWWKGGQDEEEASGGPPSPSTGTVRTEGPPRPSSLR